MSQTQWITCYEITKRQKSMIPYDLVVIDTPGFNSIDDKDFVKIQFRKLITEGSIKGLNALCFVSHSHTGRLTDNEENMSKIMAELFGSDIRDSIFVFATCADSSTPLIGKLLSRLGIFYHDVYKFNNTPFTVEHQTSRAEQLRLDWMDGKREIFKFFEELQGLRLNSLQLSQQQIKSYEKCSLRYKRQKSDIIEHCYKLINVLNNKVQYSKVKEATSDGKTITLCNKCETNCCEPCRASMISFRLCSNIEFFGGKCVVCPKKCSKDHHEWGKKTYNLKATFMDVTIGTPTSVDEEVLDEKRKRVRPLGEELSKLIEKTATTYNKVQNLLNLKEKSSGESAKDIIDDILEESKHKQLPNVETVSLILGKCRIMAGEPFQKWNDVDDLLAP